MDSKWNDTGVESSINHFHASEPTAMPVAFTFQDQGVPRQYQLGYAAPKILELLGICGLLMLRNRYLKSINEN